ncbi:MAG: hypothetical protein DHS20C21_17260 [Gemmatimonadota bacterium]|nr:MAG: hypothetical protein DHS20C21_17260 [Gemmatimonadota bacterium]
MRLSPMIRAFAGLGMLAGFGLLTGCASAPPPTALAPVDLTASQSEELADVHQALSTAQTVYFQGVRAFVAEDYETATSHFYSVRESLAFAGSETVADFVARDAENLLDKSAYFLTRIDEIAAETAPELALAEEATVVRHPVGWEVRHGAITPASNRDVDRWMKYFLKDGRDVYQRWLSRKSRYDRIFNETFARHGLPPELAFHAMIESGFNTDAYSWAHAVGLWQFVRSTGRRYGLRSDWWIDERRDPVKSSDAAARYLVELYEEFEDWELVLAAYNVGEGRVRKQIRSQKTRDFWKLRLPRETRNHIPKFYAAMILGSDPEKYGFHVSNETLPEWETVRVDFCVDFEVLAEAAGTDARTVAELNPSLVRGCSPPDEEAFAVRVPAGTGARAQSAIAELPEDKRVRWAQHRVRRGETLSHIADRYHTSVQAIVEANRLRSRHFLSINQDLIIPQGQRSGANPPSWASSRTGSSSPSKVAYRVKKGDTLSEIAERYRVSTSNLKKWNRIGKHIHPGQKLTIYAGNGASSGGTSVKVRRGDTLWDLARNHGVSLTALLSANNLRKSSVIRPGDTLRIPRS